MMAGTVIRSTDPASATPVQGQTAAVKGGAAPNGVFAELLHVLDASMATAAGPVRTQAVMPSVGEKADKSAPTAKGGQNGNGSNDATKPEKRKQTLPGPAQYAALLLNALPIGSAPANVQAGPQRATATKDASLGPQAKSAGPLVARMVATSVSTGAVAAGAGASGETATIASAASIAKPAATASQPVLPARFSQMLQTAGVQTQDVRNVTAAVASGRAPVSPSTLQHPVQVALATAVAKGDGQTQTGTGGIIATPQGHAPKSTDAKLTVPTAGLNAAQQTNQQPQQTTAPATATWSMADPDAAQKFASLLAKHAASSSGSQTLTVEVHPQGLGSLTVTVAQSSSGLNVQIQASNAQTAMWLQTETGRLTQAAQMAGLPVTAVQVATADTSAGERRGQGQNAEPKRTAGVSRNRSVSDEAEAFGVAAATGLDPTAHSISVRA